MIVMDRTVSMRDSFKPIAKLVVRYIVERRIEDLEAVGLVLFDDHYSKMSSEVDKVILASMSIPILEVHPLTSNLEEFAYYLYSAKPGWGADECEAISCAYWKAKEVAPGADIWIITDALPHGVHQDCGYLEDQFPRGCPCGKPLPPKNTKVLLDRGARSVIKEVWMENGYTNIVTLDDHFGCQAVQEAYAEAEQEAYEIVTL